MTDKSAEPSPSNEDIAKAFIEAGSTAHYAAIGKVASEWAYLEFLIDQRALEIGGIPHEIGGCFTAQIAGSGRKLDAYISLVRYLGVKKLNAKLEAFAKNTTKLAERRNRIIHDPWLVGFQSQPSRLEVTARKTLKFEVVVVPTEEVTSFRDSVNEQIGQFEDLHKAVLNELSALRET